MARFVSQALLLWASSLAVASARLQGRDLQAPEVTVYCFSGDSRVQVEHQGLVDMDQLQVGDRVWTSNNHYQSVYAFGHYQPDVETEFLSLFTHVPLEPLKLTGEHLVSVRDRDHPIRASAVQVGDVLVRDHGNDAPITSVDRFVSTGMYAPLTADGTLVVDGVAASAYVALQEDHEEFVAFPFFLGSTTHKWWSHQDYVHWTLAPFRVFCGTVSSQLCQVYTDKGLPLYIDFGISAHQWAHGYGGWVEAVFFFVAMMLFAACRLVEVTMGAQAFGPVAVMTAAYYIYHRTTRGVTANKLKTV